MTRTMNHISRPIAFEISKYLSEVLEITDPGDGTPKTRLVRYKEGLSDPDVAAKLSAALGTVITGNNIRGVRAEFHGRLYVRGAERDPTLPFPVDIGEQHDALCDKLAELLGQDFLKFKTKTNGVG